MPDPRPLPENVPVGQATTHRTDHNDAHWVINRALAVDESDGLPASAARATLALGTSATRDVGTGSGDVAAGDDSRITGALQASAATEASVPWTIVSRTTDYTAASGELILVDTTSGAVTITLPTATAGRKVIVKHTAGGNPVNLVGTVDGGTGQTVYGINESVLLVATDSAWVRASRPKFDTIVGWPDTPDARYVRLSTVTTKGDLLAATAASTLARLPVGADAQALVADSSQATGLTWSIPALIDFPATWIGAASVVDVLWGGANDARYCRSVGAGTISKIRCHIVTSSGNISVATYSRSGTGLSAAPDTRRLTSGAVPAPAAGVADVSLGASEFVSVGDYMAMSADNTTLSVKGHSGSGSTLYSAQCYSLGAAHPLPATVSSPNATTFRFPHLVGVA